MLKVGDKVVFDWDSAYHKANPSTTTVQKIYEYFGVKTSNVFTINKIFFDDRYCYIDGFHLKINVARLKKIRTNKWTIQPKY